MITFLKVLFSIVWLWMCYVVISTCLTHNLFTEWNYLGSIAWMRATLWDFYANILVVFVWICYKEKNVGVKTLWLVLLFCLGSIASCGYVLIRLFRLKKGEGLTELFTRNHA